MAADVNDPTSGRARLQDRIYARLQDEILSGELAPGSRLRIAHLAARFGSSQAPVREALNRLTEEGLAVTEPYLGTVVREPSWDEVEDIYAVRQELETYAVRRFLTRRQPIKLKSDHPIKRSFRELRRAVKAGDPSAVIDADLHFHQMVCAAADSPLTLEMWQMITKRVRGARLRYEREDPDDLTTVVATHQDLVDALESGDPVSAQQVFRDHLAAALKVLDGKRDQR